MKKRIFSLLMAVCMILNFMSLPVFAAQEVINVPTVETVVNETTTPDADTPATGDVTTPPVKDETINPPTAEEKVCACTPVVSASGVAHAVGCPLYVAPPTAEEKVCACAPVVSASGVAHAVGCPLYVAPPAAEEKVCTCTDKCTVTVINPNCPLCSVAGTDLALCKGKAAVAAMMMGASSRASTHWGSGNGSSAEAAYEISDVAGLQELATMVNGGNDYINIFFKLTKDIDLSGVPNWDTIGKFIESIEYKPFAGTFDGCNFEVKNLKITGTSADYVGLFAYIGIAGVVKNVGVTGTVSGQDNVGGLVGRNEGTVQNCYNTATVNGANMVGGVAGVNYDGILENCYNTATVNGNNNSIGGVVGSNTSNGTVKNCYNTGTVSGRLSVGGVAAVNINGGIVQNCYNTGTVTGGGYVGGVVGSNEGNGTVRNCVSLGAKVVSTSQRNTDFGKVAGLNDIVGGGILSGNKARGDMLVKGATVTADIGGDKINGEDVAADTAQSAVFSNTDFQNNTIWAVPTGKLVVYGPLPTLVGVNNAQNPTFPKEGKTDISSSIAFTDGTAEYNGSVQTYEKAKYTGDGSFAYTYAATTGKLEGGKPKGAGTYTVTASYTSATETGSKSATFTITAKPLTTATVTVGGSYTYTGLPQAPTTVTVKDGNATLTENTDYTFITTDNTNAGTATVNVTFKNNYSGTAMASFTIAKAPLTVSSGKVTPKAYDGTKTATVTELVFDGLQHSETLASTTDYTVGTATFSDADVGTGKTVTGTATLANTAKANNYTLNGAYTLKNREITKGAYTSPPTKTVNIQNGAKRTGTITLADIFGGNIPTDGAFNRMAASGTVTIMNTVALSGNGINYISNINPVNTKSTDIYIVKVTSKNYVDFIVTITFQAVDKAVVTVSGLTAQDKLVYNGTPQKGYTGNATVKGGNVDVADLVYTYTGTGNTSYNSATAPTNAGSYKLTVAVPSSNADYAGNQSVNFAIAQAPLTITAASYDVYQYKQVPDLSKLKITLIYTGFVNGEGTSVLKGKYTAAYADAGVNTDTPKDYAINVIVASETNKNYGITTKDGKLKVWEAKKDDAPAAKLPNRPITYPTVVAEPASGKTLRLVVASLMTSEQTQTETWLNSNLGTESLREAHEIELQVSSDGTNWSAATIADLLGGKTQAVLSIPKGASPLTHDLFVYHFAKGAGQAATLENAAYNAAANALVVEVTSYSPFVVVAVPKSAGTPVTPPAQPNDTNVIDYENEFWIGVTSKIAAAKKGNAIKIDTGSYNKMPATIMEELRLKGVGMVITSNGEKQITIPAGKAKNAENGRHFWSLSQLAELYKNHTFTEKPNKQNPSTNGYTDTNTGITEPVLGAVVEVTKPQTHQASVIIFVAAAVALGAFVLKRKNEF